MAQAEDIVVEDGITEIDFISEVIDDVFATGDGVGTKFYLGGKFSVPTGDLGVIAGTSTIKKSVGGTGDFLEATESVDYTISESTGEITWIGALPSGDVISADYRFRYRVRFKDSNLTRRAFAFQLWETGLELIQVI